MKATLILNSKDNNYFVFLLPQSHVHGHARSTEDQQQDGDLDYAGRFPRGPKDERGVPESCQLQMRFVKGH